MKIGITGTSTGCTEEQLTALRILLNTWRPTEIHHGDCVGADAEAHCVVRRLSFYVRIIGHPPTDDKKRAHCQFDVTMPERPYLERNHNIVDATDLLIALPKGDGETLRSGTWATARYAGKKGKTVLIVRSNGTGYYRQKETPQC